MILDRDRGQPAGPEGGRRWSPAGPRPRRCGRCPGCGSSPSRGGIRIAAGAALGPTRLCQRHRPGWRAPPIRRRCSPRLQAIEARAGRVRGEANAARTAGPRYHRPQRPAARRARPRAAAPRAHLRALRAAAAERCRAGLGASACSGRRGGPAGRLPRAGHRRDGAVVTGRVAHAAMQQYLAFGGALPILIRSPHCEGRRLSAWRASPLKIASRRSRTGSNWYCSPPSARAICRAARRSRWIVTTTRTRWWRCARSPTRPSRWKSSSRISSSRCPGRPSRSRRTRRCWISSPPTRTFSASRMFPPTKRRSSCPSRR